MIVRNGKDGEIYNVGGHEEKANIDIVKIILDKLNKPTSLIEFVKDRPGHDLRYAMNSSKLERELGWKPSVTFDEGIDKTITWYLYNKPWWEHIISGEYKNYFDKMYGYRMNS